MDTSIAGIPRFPLTEWPTPLEELSRLTRALGGPRLLIKRDDQSTLAFGGNKIRKLEFLLADALAAGADTLITAGGPQSNHCRLSAAAAARAGLACELVLGGAPPASPWQGNLLLDRMLGARVHWTRKERRIERMDELASELRAQGRRPYVIPIGGSTGLGALGYVDAMTELRAQLAERACHTDRVVLATSSGGTQAGLQLGARLSGFVGEVLGISIDQSPTGEPRFTRVLAGIANEAAGRLGTDTRFADGDFSLCYDYLGAGYGVVGEPEREAIALTAREEGVFLGPVYTARAMAGLIDLIRKGEIGARETVVFWHTGDLPTLFAYREEIT